MSNIIKPTRLENYPYIYDYVHVIQFKENGEVSLADGAGQRLNIKAIGKFNVIDLDETSAEFEFYDMTLVMNPYRSSETTEKIELPKVKVEIEPGIFPFMSGVPIKFENEEEYPCILYENRYVFEFDPFEFAKIIELRTYSINFKNRYYRICQILLCPRRNATIKGKRFIRNGYPQRIILEVTNIIILVVS